jgi:hypothetical protein
MSTTKKMAKPKRMVKWKERNGQRYKIPLSWRSSEHTQNLITPKHSTELFLPSKWAKMSNESKRFKDWWFASITRSEKFIDVTSNCPISDKNNPTESSSGLTK